AIFRGEQAERSGRTFVKDVGQFESPSEPQFDALCDRHQYLTTEMHTANSRGDHGRAMRLQAERRQVSEAIARYERGEVQNPAEQREGRQREPAARRSEPAPVPMSDETAQREIGALAAARLDGAPIEHHPIVRGALDRFERYVGDTKWDGSRDLAAAKEFVQADPALLE